MSSCQRSVNYVRKIAGNSGVFIFEEVEYHQKKDHYLQDARYFLKMDRETSLTPEDYEQIEKDENFLLKSSRPIQWGIFAFAVAFSILFSFWSMVVWLPVFIGVHFFIQRQWAIRNDKRINDFDGFQIPVSWIKNLQVIDGEVARRLAKSINPQKTHMNFSDVAQTFRKKLTVGHGWEEVLLWLEAVDEVYDLDKKFPVNLIPLFSSEVQEVVEELRRTCIADSELFQMKSLERKKADEERCHYLEKDFAEESFIIKSGAMKYMNPRLD